MRNSSSKLGFKFCAIDNSYRAFFLSFNLSSKKNAYAILSLTEVLNFFIPYSYNKLTA